jgi:O-antigen/teichoic acid export membrane protein
MLFFGASWMIRCLGPKNLGISAVILSTVNLSALLINLGLSFTGARTLATDKSRCRETIELIMGIRLRMAISLFGLWMVASAILFALGVPNALAWAIGALVFLALAPNPQWVLQGMGNLPFYSKSLAVGAALTAASYLLFFRPGFGAGSDIFVNAISSFVVLTITWRYIRKNVGARLFCSIDYRAAWNLIKQSRYAFGGAVMLYFYSQFDVVIISYFTDPTQAGFYRAANTFISPMSLIVTVSDAILFPRLAVMHKANPKQFLKQSIRLSGLYAAGATVTALLAVPLCSLLVTALFGAKYSSAVHPAQILIVSTCVSVVCGPFRWGLMAGNRDGVFFMNSTLGAVVAVALNVVLVPHFGAPGAALARLLSQLVLFLSSGLLCYRLFGR